MRISLCLVIAFAGFNVTAAVLLQTLCPAAALRAPVLGRNSSGEGNGCVGNFQSLTEGSHSVCLYGNFELRNADLEMPRNRTDIAERELKLEVLKDDFVNKTRYLRETEL